jgi:hypothetical protein
LVIIRRCILTDTFSTHLQQIKLEVSSLLDRIGDREFPLVYVVEEDSEEDRFVWEMQYQDMPQAQRAQMAKDNGILVLDGQDVLEHLAGEMDPDAEEILRDEVAAISAAREGKVILDDNGSTRRVSVEELVEEDVEGWLFLGLLQSLTTDLPVPFTVEPTARVLEFVQASERGA